MHHHLIRCHPNHHRRRRNDELCPACVRMTHQATRNAAALAALEVKAEEKRAKVANPLPIGPGVSSSRALWLEAELNLEADNADTLSHARRLGVPYARVDGAGVRMIYDPTAKEA